MPRNSEEVGEWLGRPEEEDIPAKPGRFELEAHMPDRNFAGKFEAVARSKAHVRLQRDDDCEIGLTFY